MIKKTTILVITSLLNPLTVVGTQSIRAAVGAATQQQQQQDINHRGLIRDVAGYRSFTDISDHLAIDQDVRLIYELVMNADREEDFALANQIYHNGGSVASFAKLSITNGPINVAIAEGTSVVGQNKNSNQVTLRTMGSHPQGTTTLQAVYQVESLDPDRQDGPLLQCFVGGRPAINEAVYDDCLVEQGTIEIDNVGSFTYTYNRTLDNRNNVTLLRLSREAEQKNTPPANYLPTTYYPTYQTFVDYYGRTDYADQWIRAAFSRGIADLDRGTLSFSNLRAVDRANAIYHGIVLLSIFMEVLRHMEDALYQCRNRMNGGRSWDLAFSDYTGLQESDTATADEGFLLHQLADDLCRRTKTCGTAADFLAGRSFVNFRIVQNFRQAQNSFDTGGCTDNFEAHKNAIESYMVAMLVQGVMVGFKASTVRNGLPGVREVGAAYTAGLLPYLHKCSPQDAGLVSRYLDNLHLTLEPSDFAAVKTALERNYACLGILCSDVGGVINPDNNEFFDDAMPCQGNGGGTTSGSTVGSNTGTTGGTTIGSNVETTAGTTVGSNVETIENTPGPHHGFSNRTAVVAGSASGAVAFLFLVLCLTRSLKDSKKQQSSPPVENGQPAEQANDGSGLELPVNGGGGDAAVAAAATPVSKTEAEIL